MIAAASTVALLATTLLAVPAGASSEATGNCPAHGAAHLGRPVAETREMATAAAASSSPRCARLGATLERYLDAGETDPCSRPPETPAADGNEPDADLFAVESALAWRCGHARAAHAAAVRALRLDPAATLAWTTLGRLLDARFAPGPAGRAFERAIELDPEETGALAGLAKLTADPQGRTEYLRRLIAAGPGRGELERNLRHARELIALIESLGDRSLWVVDRLELPAVLKLKPFVARPGSVSGWMVTAGLGGAKNVRTLFDTGASGLHVAPHTANRAGVEPLTQGTLVGGGGEGEHAVERGVFERLDLGPISYKDPLAQVAAGSFHERGTVQAILGADVFDGLLLRLDTKKKRLEIRESETTTEENDPLQVDPWPGDPAVLPILRVDGQLLVPLDLAPADTGRRAWLVLDTGSALTLLDVAFAADRPEFRSLGNRRARLYGGYGRLEGSLGSLRATLGASSMNLRDVPVIDAGERSRLSGMRVGGFLGLDALAGGPFEIDLARGTLRLSPGDESGKRH